MKQLILLISFSFIIVTNLSAHDFYFSRIDGKNGLSHNNVKSIVQDSYGFMWFGTRNRLNRYDGVSLKQFDCYDPRTNKRNNNIGALHEDPDKILWVGTDKGIFLFDPLKEIFTSFDCKTDKGIAITDWIADIQCDSDNNIWVVVPNQGVFKYASSLNKLYNYSVVDKLKPSVSNPQCITIEKNGKVWIGTNGSGVYLYNKSTDSFSQYLGDEQGDKYLVGKNIYAISHDNDYLIIGIHESKLMKLDKRRNILIDTNTNEINYKIIRDVRALNDNEIWVATESGLFVIDEKKHIISQSKEDPLNPYSLSDLVAERIYQDKEGGVWIGTKFGGVNYLPSRYNKFEKYFPSSDNKSISSKRVREIKEDSNGNILIGTEDAGITVFDPKTQEFKKMNSLFYNKTLALLVSNNNIWVGYFKNGLDIIGNSQNAASHYSFEELGLDEASVCALCEDRYGRIWLGNAWGIFIAEKNERKFKRMDAFGLSYTYDILEDSDGYMWVATIGNGVFQYNPKNEQVSHFTSNGENTLSSNTVSSITEDHLGQIWFSTDRGGICVYNKMNKTFKSYSIKDGLPDDITYKILEDKKYNLWFGTNQGLVKFNPETKDIKVFTKNDGLLSNQYNYKSALLSSSNKLYFGCVEGLIAFDPEEFKENKFIPPVYITKFLISNEEINPGTENSPLEKSIIHTDKIKLSYNQSSIGFNFVALNYSPSLTNMYAYKMEPVDNDWVYTNNNHSAFYAKLPAGKYVFKVKASNNDNVWNEVGQSVEIEILPPWWLSTIAIISYILFVGVVSFLIIRYSLAKYKKRNSEKQKLFEIEKERELYETKVNFFTDIAHEIRTPVTLINGPLESILSMEIQDKKVKRNLEIIESNTKHLLNLINQLLDFRKVDSDRFLLSLKKVDIVCLLDDTLKRFEGQLASTKKSLTIDQSVTNKIVVADKEALSKILDNLFSNAIKYSKQKIDVKISSDSSYFTIQVMNDGELVADELKNKIFEPFFQIHMSCRETSGSGIGLALARSLAELHNGYLHYDSQRGMNNFILKIPVNQESEIEEDITFSKQVESKNPLERRTTKQTVLVVEDNAEMQGFISDLLTDKFVVERASNGQEAQAVLKQKTIDVIISDIMMPLMDGFELCTYVKSNPEYNNIIVILLTAKNDLDSKIKGLKLGADAYVEKPFSPNYLQTLMTSLQKNRQREIELFLKKPFLPLLNKTINKGDEEFLNKAIEAINENITDPNFNVERLADALYLSRSSLHRKIKTVTDTSPIDFIRLVRLQKSAQLIQEGKFRINEICYLVGMSTPSYFIKLFQNHFGMTPKEFEIQNKS